MNNHLGVISTIICYVFINIFWYLIFKNLPLKINNSHYLMMALISMSVIYFCKFHEYTYSRKFNDLLGHKPSTKHYKDIMVLVIMFILIGIGASALLIYIEAWSNLDSTIVKWGLISRNTFLDIQWLKSWLVMHGITIMIIAPITEELIFRGLILNRLLSKYSPMVAILISALIFALAHLNKSFISSFIHGAVLAMIAIRYGSLYYPIIIHGIYNGIVMLLQKYFGVMFVADIEKIHAFSYWIPEFIALLSGLFLMFIFYQKSFKNSTYKSMN